MPFQKGHQKHGGRVAGTPNKIDLKECTLKAFDMVGGAKYLETIAKKSPQAFLNFLGKFVTRDLQLSGNPENAEPIALVIRGYNERNKPTSSSS